MHYIHLSYVPYKYPQSKCRFSQRPDILSDNHCWKVLVLESIERMAVLMQFIRLRYSLLLNKLYVKNIEFLVLTLYTMKSQFQKCYVVYRSLRSHNSDHFLPQPSLIRFYNRDREFLLCGTSNSVFKAVLWLTTQSTASQRSRPVLILGQCM